MQKSNFGLDIEKEKNVSACVARQITVIWLIEHLKMHVRRCVCTILFIAEYVNVTVQKDVGKFVGLTYICTYEHIFINSL